MATNLATAYVAVVPSLEGVQGNLTRQLVPQVGNAAEKAGREGGKRMGSALGDSLKRAAGVALAAFSVGAIVGGMKEAITEAGNLEQSVGAISTVFKANSAQMDAWARGAAKNLGLSRNQYNEFGTLIGAQLKNAGVAIDEVGPKTNELITLGADLSSMYGGTVADAIAAVSSTLKGEMDPIQAYGITMTAASIDAEAAAMGFEKVGDAFDNEAKAAATMNLLMKQSQDAHGNFAKEASTYAGQVARLGASWDDAQAKVGELFLPVMTSAVQLLSERVVPIVTEVAGGIMAFGASWRSTTDDITSTGFAGFMEASAIEIRGLYETVGQAVNPALERLGAIVRDSIVPAMQSATEWVSDHRTVLSSVATVLGTMVAAYYATLVPAAMYAVATGVATGASTALHVVVGRVQSGLATLAIRWLYLNAAMMANPVGIVVAVLAGLVAAVILAWKHSETFRRVVTGAWEGIKAVASSVGQWFTATLLPTLLGVWSGIRAGIGAVTDWWSNTAAPAVTGAVQAVGRVFTWLNTNVVQPVWTAIKTITAVQIAIILTIVDGLVWVFRNTLGPVFRWLYENVVRPVWEGIQRAISAVASWFSTVLVPGIQARLTILAAAWNTARDTVARVWAAIRAAIGAAVTFVRDRILSPLITFLSATLAVAWGRARDTVSTVWAAIRAAINAAWTFVRDNVFRPIVAFLDATMGPAFRFLRDNVVAPVWNRIRELITAAWTTIRDKALQPLVNFARDTIGKAFEKGVEAVRTAWDKIKKIVSGPVDFVVNTVINDGFIKNFNRVAKPFGIDPLDEISFDKGFRDGGYTGRMDPNRVAGLVHGDEQVIKSPSRRSVEAAAPGFLDALNEKGAAALGWLADPARMAIGDGVHGQSWSFSNPLQHAIYASGRMGVMGSAPGYDLPGAIAMLDRATSVKVERADRMSNDTVHVGVGSYPHWWGGYYSNYGVRLNSATTAHMGTMQKRTLLAHELGHAIGLPHAMSWQGGNGAWSVMNYDNMYLHNSITAADVAALSTIYGGSGQGSSPGSGGGSNIVERIVEKLLETIGFDNLMDKVPGAGIMADMMTKAAEKAWEGFKSWAAEKLNPFDGGGRAEGATATVYDGGGWLERSAQPQLVHHRTAKPDAVLSNEQWGAVYRAAQNPNRGGPSVVIENLQALDMDDAAKSLDRERRKREALFSHEW